MPIDGEVATPARTASKSNDLARPQQVAEVDGNQEWEICDIISKEDVDGVVHYLVAWNATLVPKYALKKAKRLVDKFEARLRAQRRQRDKRGRGRLPRSKLGRQAGGHAIGGTNQKKQRGGPRKQS